MIRRNRIPSGMQNRREPEAPVPQETPPCAFPGCPYRVNHRKPYCTMHVLEHPYARDLNDWALRWEAPVTRAGVLRHPKAEQLVATLDRLHPEAEDGWVGAADVAKGAGLATGEVTHLLRLLVELGAVAVYRERHRTWARPRVGLAKLREAVA